MNWGRRIFEIAIYTFAIFCEVQLWPKTHWLKFAHRLRKYHMEFLNLYAYALTSCISPEQQVRRRAGFKLQSSQLSPFLVL